MKVIIVINILICLLDLSYGVHISNIAQAMLMPQNKFKDKAFKKKTLGKPTTPAPKTPMDEMLIEKYEICKDREGNKPDDSDAVNLKKKGGIPTSEGGKCLATCMMKEAGLLGSDDKFSVKGCQELVKKMAPHMAGPASDFYINECNKKISAAAVEGQCDVAPKVISCFSMLKMTMIPY